MGACAPDLAGVTEKVFSGGKASNVGCVSLGSMSHVVETFASRRKFMGNPRSSTNTCHQRHRGEFEVSSRYVQLNSIKGPQCNDTMSLARFTFRPTTEANDKNLD